VETRIPVETPIAGLPTRAENQDRVTCAHESRSGYQSSPQYGRAGHLFLSIGDGHGQAAEALRELTAGPSGL